MDKELARFSCGHHSGWTCDMRGLPSSNPNERLIVVRVYMRTAKHTAHASNITVYIAIFAAVWVGGSTKLTVWPAGAGLIPTCVDMISVMVRMKHQTCRKNISSTVAEGRLKKIEDDKVRWRSRNQSHSGPTWIASKSSCEDWLEKCASSAEV